MTHRIPLISHPRHVVTAVLVAHDGARWLPTTLQAVKTQRRPVQRFVAVDTGSRDDTRTILEHAVGAASIVDAPRDAGFGEAVHLAVAAFATAPPIALPANGSSVEWLWLLHDDSAPEPRALEALLALADQMPSAAVIGPKLVDWHDPEVLLEVGYAVDRGGHRQTGIEPGELDHGQHDGDRDVLAVSTAGMLIRRDVWDELGGLDPHFPLFRDDLDFCWRVHLAGERVVVCSRAVVRHARAAASGQRHLSCVPPGSHRPVSARRLDRQGALSAWLANCGRLAFPFVAARLAIATLIRFLLFLLIKRPSAAWQELAAGLAVFGRPARLARLRRSRRPLRRVPGRELRSLFAPIGVRLRHHLDQWAASRADGERRGAFRRALSNPGLLLTLGLAVVALVAERHVIGSPLHGGALLPAPPGASDLWDRYLASWHPTGFGSSDPAPPYLAVVALLGSVLFGSARLAVAVLLLGSVPLAGAVAYRCSRWVFPSLRVRCVAAALYALTPVATGAIGAGRLGTAVALVVLPALLLEIARALLPTTVFAIPAGTRHGRRPASVRHVWAAGLLLAVLAAFEPLGLLLTGGVLALGFLAALVRRRFGEALRCVVIAGVPLLLLAPWTPWLWSHPGRFLTGLGRVAPGLQDPRLTPLDLVLAHPGGPGMPPMWVEAAVLVGALVGLARGQPGAARAGWTAIAIGVGGGIFVSRTHVTVPPGLGAGEVAGWPGIATGFVAAGLALAAAAGLRGLRGWLRSASFGWRHPATLLLAAALVATPVVIAGQWIVRGTGSVLATGPTDVLPISITDPTTVHGQPRTLLLRPDGAAVRYTLLRDRSPDLGDAELQPDADQVAVLDEAVGDLAGGFGDAAAAELSRAGVRFVLLPQSATDLTARIAAAGGVGRRGASGEWTIWELQPGGARLAVTDGSRWQPVLDGDFGRSTLRATVAPGPPSRLLVLAEAPSPRWKAVVGGSRSDAVPLVASSYQGMQAFVLPASGGQVEVFRLSDSRTPWLIAELVATVIVVWLALPGATQRRTVPVPTAERVRVPVGAMS